LLHDVTTAESFRAGYGGTGSLPHGGCGADWAKPCTSHRNRAHSANPAMRRVRILVSVSCRVKAHVITTLANHGKANEMPGAKSVTVDQLYTRGSPAKVWC